MEGDAENNQAFLLVPPVHVLDTYSIEISQMDVDILQLNESDDALIFNIVTFGSSQSMTVNLKGPIVINRHSMQAKQVVPVNAMTLPTTYPLNN
jgi:flagellar assembly factor FliW